MRNKLTKSLIAVSVLAALAGCNDDNGDNGNNVTAHMPIAEPFSLTIAHMNDTHSNFDPVKSSFTTGTGGDVIYNEFGGYPRLLQASNDIIKASAEAKTPMLLLHGGDAWQGTVYFSLNKGAANADLLSQMHIDAMAMGNHEFDETTKELASFVGEVNFPVLAANIDASADADLSASSNLKAYQLFAFDGITKRAIDDVASAEKGEFIVAVIGIALEGMPDIAEGVGEVKFANEITSTQTTVDALTTAGVNKIVILSHIGTERDVLLAEGTTGVDVIVGGHSHSLLGDFTYLGKGDNGDYAQLVTQKDGKGKTCIVQAGQYAQAIGQAEVRFDVNGELASCEGNNTLLSSDEFYEKERRESGDLIASTDKDKVIDFIDNTKQIEIVAEDSDLRAHIDATYKPGYDAAFGETVATVDATIVQERRPGDKGTDKHGSDVAPIIGQAFIDWANQAEVNAVTHLTAQISFVPAGGVRTNITAGDLKEGNVTLEMLPFNTYMSVLTLTGTQIKEVLNTTIKPTLKRDAHAGKFPYVGGMRYTYTETEREVVGSITNLDLNTGTEVAPVWEAMLDASSYVVVLGNYNAKGRDGWGAIAEPQELATDRVDVIIENDAYKGYPVDKLTFVLQDDGTKKYTPVYEGDASLDCKADGVRCNTDAQAFIDYAKSKGTIAPLTFETTTMEYMPEVN
jgi:5'-nucleotidase